MEDSGTRQTLYTTTNLFIQNLAVTWSFANTNGFWFTGEQADCQRGAFPNILGKRRNHDRVTQRNLEIIDTLII